jgi:hypothetical protein
VVRPERTIDECADAQERSPRNPQGLLVCQRVIPRSFKHARYCHSALGLSCTCGLRQVAQERRDRARKQLIERYSDKASPKKARLAARAGGPASPLGDSGKPQ